MALELFLGGAYIRMFTVLKKVQLVEPELDSDGGNNSISATASQVLLFMTVIPTDETLSGMGLAQDEGSNGERPPEGDPCQ